MYQIIGFIILVIFCVNITEIICRYFFDFSNLWIIEVSRFLNVWFVFLGASEITRRREHLTVGISLGKYLKGFSKDLLEIVVNIFGIVALVIVDFKAIEAVFKSSSITAPASGIPMWMVWSALPINLTIMIYFIGRDTVRQLLKLTVREEVK